MTAGLSPSNPVDATFLGAFAASMRGAGRPYPRRGEARAFKNRPSEEPREAKNRFGGQQCRVRRRGRSSTVTRSRSRPRNRLRRDVRGYGCVLCWLGIILSSAYEHSEVADGHDEGCPGRRFQCFIDNCGARFRRRGFDPNPSRGCRVRRFRLWFSNRVSVLLSAAGLLPATAALPRPGLLSRIRDTISAVRRLRSLCTCREPSITYTPRRGWTNAQGQYCREYRTTGPA